MRTVGFFAKTGSAIAVVLDLDPKPALVDRRTLTLVPDGVERFVFHNVEHRPKDAPKEVREATTVITKHAKAEIKKFAAEAGPFDAAAVIGTTLEMPGTTEQIIAAHPKMHTAEGILFRAAIADGLTTLGVTPTLVPATDLGGQQWVVDALGKVSSPWTKQHREAAMAAAVAAGFTSGRASGRGRAPRTAPAAAKRRRS